MVKAAGTLVGEDQFGNKYVHDLVEGIAPFSPTPGIITTLRR
jgi:hypothetical protein